MIFGESVLGKLAMTFFMAMVPVVELRGAIPLGVAAGLPPAVAAVTAMAGNLTPVPCILLLLRRVFALMRKSAWLGPKVDRLERRAHLKGRTVRKYRTLGLVLLGVMVAVGFRAVLWKLVLVLVIQWYTSPLSSHMLAQFEYRAGQEDLARYLELPEETEEVSAP